MALSISNTTILYACLNWGNGHLSRSIGVIRELIERNNTIIFAGDDFQQSVMKEYFPTIQILDLNGYPFNFSESGNFAKDIFRARKSLFKHVRSEFDQVEQFLQKFPQISCVISDHRYGFYSTKVKSVFITHQVYLPIKWFQFTAQYIHQMLLEPFNEIWIMDVKTDRLAGKLSAPPKRKKFQYIGLYSRFEKGHDYAKKLKLGVVNGPKPFSDMLFNKLLNNNDLDNIIVPEILYYKSLDSRLVNTKSWKEADLYFYKASIIHAYCGYSTLMDLKILECQGILEPTPGQLEQEYLYSIHYGM